MKCYLVLGQLIVLSCSLVASFLVSPQKTQSETNPAVIINELMWMGSSDSSSDEWLELRNLSNQQLDLSNWYLTKKSNSTDVIMITLPEGSVIESNDFFLISNYSSDSDNSILNVEPDLVDTSVSLVNSGLQIKLFDSFDSLIDTADDGLGKPLAGEYESSQTWQSMERDIEYSDGALESSWHTADSSYNFDAGSVELGTPRWANSNPNQPPIAEAGQDQSVIINETVYFDGTDSTDPDGDSLTYHWDFGDDNESTEATPTHRYSQPDQYEVTLTVSDGNDEAEDRLMVEVTNPEPGEPSPEPEETIKYPNSLRINELLPNPEGSDSEFEFIELYNFGSTDIDLSSWSISDASRSYTIDKGDFNSTLIESGGWFVLPRTISKIALNNSSPETITLSDPNGEMIDELYYELPVPENLSYNFYQDSWYWSETITQGKENVIARSEETTEDDSPDGTNNKSAPEEDKSTVEYDYSKNILITELLPNPEGPDAEEEYIELANFDKNEINLLGWELTDTKTYFEITEPLLLAPGEYISFNRTDTKIALNNSAEQVYLVDPAEKMISGVSYTKAKEGKSWSRIGQTDNWSWSDVITPERENVIEIDEEGAEEESESSSKNETIETSLSEIKSLPSRQAVKTQGVVVVEPGILGKQLFYINQQEAGIQIYSSKSDFPELSLGDLIEISGTMGESQGEKKINIKTAEDIKIIGQSELPEPILITSVELGEDMEGRLVQIEGDVLERSGQTITIDSGGEVATVYIKKTTDIKASDYKEGNSITAIGLVSQTKSGYRILPRSTDDITKAEVLGESTETNKIEEETIDIQAENSRQKTLIYLSITLGVLIVTGRLYYWRNKKK